MSISDPYKETLRRRAVTRFIKENQRSPSTAELKELVSVEEANYPSVDQVGVSGFDIVPPQFMDESSTEVENANRNALLDDMQTLSERLDDLIQLLEDSNRGFYATVHRTGRLLTAQEGRVDNLLVLNSNVDVFVHGVEETFDTQEAVDFTASDASVESGFVTLGRSGFTPIDLDTAKVRAVALAENGIVGQSGTSQISALKENDGDIWEYLVYTKSQQGNVSLVVEIELSDAEYVGEMRLAGLPVAGNSPCTVSAFYSLDGKTFTIVEPAERSMTPEMVFNVGLDGVQKIQFRLSKSAADTTTVSRNQNVYVFSLDAIQLYGDKYQTSRTSTLVAGPYDLADEEGNAVFFTKATLAACTIEPNETSLNFFLSNDGESWEPVSHNGTFSSFVSFANGAAAQSSSFVESDNAAGALIDSVLGLEEIDFQTEAVLNTYIGTEFSTKVPLHSFAIKRNITYTAAANTILKTSPGWMFEDSTNQQSTTIYVANAEGRYLDLGPTSAYLNGQKVSGRVYVPAGYSVFVTDDRNFIDVPTGIVSADALKLADPLYPYNHKYLVEGYTYTGAFVGEQVYQPVDSYFGALLTYLPPEEFAFLEKGDARYYRVFTIENADGNWYIKVKVDKTDASWLQEYFEPDWAVQDGPSSQIYVKAILNTSDNSISPMIDSYKVRVI